MADEIPQGWRKCKLGDVADIMREVIEPQKALNDIFTLYSIPAFDNGKIPEILSGYEIQSSKYHIVMKCILISKLNPGVSRVWKIIDPSPDKISSTEFIPLKIKENKGDVAFDYVYYLLKNPIFYKLFEEWANGTSGSHQRIKPNQILDLDILLPPLPEQRAIASVLGSLDGKIDLLHKENQTLEQLAETIFRQWFIEEADNSWEEVPLKNIYIFEKGFEPGSENYLEEKEDDVVRFIRVGDMLESMPSVYVKVEIATKRCKENDLLMSFDGTVGRVNFGLEGAYSTGIRKIYSLDPIYDNLGLKYLIFKSKDIQEMVDSFSSGTVILHASSSINYLTFCFPKKEILIEFNQIIAPFFAKMKENIFQTSILENLRDTLLPKLMSGEVRVEI